MLLDILTFLVLLAWLYLAFGNGFFWKPLLDKKVPNLTSQPSVDIIVPARNEAEILPKTLPSLLDQDYARNWKILLVDDHSTDGTNLVAKEIAKEKDLAHRLHIINAPDVPTGWSGKVAAMQAGVTQSQADFILFTDADIHHNPSSLRNIVARAQKEENDLTSLMVKLRTKSFAEKMMIPAFVFFFAMLYPFRRVADPTSKIAAAAGGVMLVRRKKLDQSGGLKKIKGALIDDCSLAKSIKKSGGRLKLTLTRDSRSLRPYPHMKDVHNMIARTAFTQLRYSHPLLIGTVLGLAILFFLPFASLTSNSALTAATSVATLSLMILLYVPMIRFYGLSPLWAASLPFAAIFYIVATLDSAKRHNCGHGGLWKGRKAAS